jgi:hypothetical protein
MIKKMFFAVLALGMLASCSDDDDDDGGQGIVLNAGTF